VTPTVALPGFAPQAAPVLPQPAAAQPTSGSRGRGTARGRGAASGVRGRGARGGVSHGNVQLDWSVCTKDLGITMDPCLEFYKHVSNIVHAHWSRNS